LQYNESIDEIIITGLLENVELGYNGLKSLVDKSRHKKLSYETFSFHVKKLLGDKTLSKDDPGKRGFKVKYSLMPDAKKKRELQILGYDRKQLMRRKLYERILLFEFSRFPIWLEFNQIRSFLNELGIRSEDLKIMSVRLFPSEEEIREWLDIRAGKEHVSERQFRKNIEKFAWTQTLYEPVRVSGDLEIQIWKNKHQNSDSRNKYGVSLPGFSQREVLNKGKFGDLKPASTELEEAFDTLLKERIIRLIAFIFKGEMRYVIADDNLRDMIMDIWGIHMLEWLLLYDKWSYLEKPSEEEKKWLYWASGEKEAKRTLQDAEIKRHALQKKRNMSVGLTRKSVSEHQNELDHKIRNFKIKHKRTLEQYSHLADIIRQVSPIFAMVTWN